MVAPALIGAIVGAGYGAAHYKSDKAEADRNRQLQATIARQSPWTGMQANTAGLQNPSLLGNITQGGLSGATFGQGNFGKQDDAAAAPGGGAPAQASPADPSAMAAGPNSGNGPLQAYQNPEDGSIGGQQQQVASINYLQGNKAQYPWLNVKPQTNNYVGN